MFVNMIYVYLMIACILNITLSDFVPDNIMRNQAICVNFSENCATYYDGTYFCPQNYMCETFSNKCMCKYGYQYSENCNECIQYNVLTNCTDPCPDEHDIPTCHDESCKLCICLPSNHDVFLTATQIAMSCALMLGVLILIAVVWKLCIKDQYRSRGRGGRGRGRGRGRRTCVGRGSNVSEGSLQRVVSERLRDAPPPYCGILPPPGDHPPPYHILTSRGHTNASFVVDESVPPPDYSAIISDESGTMASNIHVEINNNQESKNISESTNNNKDGAIMITTASISIHM